MRNRAPNPLSPPRQTLGLSTPRPSRPNPHPTPLTPRTPRGECAPRQRDGFSGFMNGYADIPPYHPSPWLYGQSGCGHFIKSPHIIYRLAHRTAAGFPPRPSQPNPHPTPLTPRTPRGECYGQGVRWWLHVGALSAGCKMRPTSCAPICIFTTTNAQPSAKIGCRHFIKSLHIIYRLPHRTAHRLGVCPAPLSPLHRAGLWRCLRRLRAFICLRAVVAVPLSSVCLSLFIWPFVLFGCCH